MTIVVEAEYDQDPETKTSNISRMSEKAADKGNASKFISLGGDNSQISKPDAEVEETSHDVKESPEVTSPKAEVAEDDQKPEKAKGVQARISELTRKRREAERDAAKWQEEAINLQRKLSELKEPEPAQYAGKPGEYVKAMVDFKTESAKTPEIEKTTAAKLVAAQETLKEEFNEKAAVFTETHPDFPELRAKLPLKIFNDRLAYHIMASDCAPELTYYLGKNLDIAVQYSDMNDLELTKAIAKFEAKIEIQNMATESSVTKKGKSKAGAPITPIKAAELDYSGLTLEEASKISHAAYVKVRANQVKDSRTNW